MKSTTAYTKRYDYVSLNHKGSVWKQC